MGKSHKRIKIRIFENVWFKICVFIVTLLFVTTFIFYMLIVRLMDQYTFNELIKRGESLARSVAVSAAHSLLSGDFPGIDTIIVKLKDVNSDVDYIAVIDAAHKVISHTDLKKKGERVKPASGNLLKRSKDLVIHEKSDISGNCFEVVTPIKIKETYFGNVLVGLNKSLLTDMNRRARERLLAGLAAILIPGIIGIFMLSSVIARPVKELSAGVDELKKGTRSNTLRIYSKDELGRLTEDFNEMSKLINEQKQSLSKYAHELKEAYVSTVKVLAAAIDARDPYTLGHSTRVSKLSLKLGEVIGLSKKELEDLEITCLFHDVGKIKTPDIILNKRGKLNSSEYREIMNHPQTGAEILSKATSLLKYIPAVKYHHEWYNGEGYPEGLSKDRIPLFASIASIADAFDAMTSQRPYRNALSEGEAIKELVNFSGKQFDPYLVEVFISVINERNFYRY